MTRVLMATHPWGVLQDRAGNARADLTATFTNVDLSPVTHWSAATGGTSSTAAVAADNRGRLMRWIESGIYNQTVDGETLEVHATPGSVESRVTPSTEVADAAIVTAQGKTPYRIPKADKKVYDLTAEWIGAQPSDVIGYLHDALARAAITGGRVEPGDGYFEVSEPICFPVGGQLVGQGTYQTTVLRDGVINRGHGSQLIQIPDTAALGGGETWFGLKSGSNCPIFRFDGDNSEGKRGPAWGNSWAGHHLIKGIVLDHNGRGNQSATVAVDLTNGAFIGFEDVRLVAPFGKGIVANNCNDVSGHGIFVIGQTDAVANGVGDVALGSRSITNATGTWNVGDFITGTGIPAGAYLVTVVGATITYSSTFATPTAAGTGVTMSRTRQNSNVHLELSGQTTDSWWTRVSMHNAAIATLMIDGGRGNNVEGFLGYSTTLGGNNVRMQGSAAHNVVKARLDAARGHSARLDSTTHDNQLYVNCLDAGMNGSAADADGGWVGVFDDGVSNAAYGAAARGWGSNANMVGVHRFGPNASEHGVSGMGGGSDLAAGSEKHRNLSTGGAGRSCVAPGPQPWSVPGYEFKPAVGSAATVVPFTASNRYNVLTFDPTTVQSAQYTFRVPAGCNGLIVAFEVLNQTAANTGVTMWDVQYSDYPSLGGNTPGAAEQSWLVALGGGTAYFGRTIGANSQTHEVRHPTRAGSIFTTVPGDTAVVHITRKADDAGDTLASLVGLLVVKFEPIMVA